MYIYIRVARINKSVIFHGVQPSFCKVVLENGSFQYSRKSMHFPNSEQRKLDLSGKCPTFGCIAIKQVINFYRRNID